MAFWNNKKNNNAPVPPTANPGTPGRPVPPPPPPPLPPIPPVPPVGKPLAGYVPVNGAPTEPVTYDETEATIAQTPVVQQPEAMEFYDDMEATLNRTPVAQQPEDMDFYDDMETTLPRQAASAAPQTAAAAPVEEVVFDDDDDNEATISPKFKPTIRPMPVEVKPAEVKPAEAEVTVKELTPINEEYKPDVAEDDAPLEQKLSETAPVASPMAGAGFRKPHNATTVQSSELSLALSSLSAKLDTVNDRVTDSVADMDRRLTGYATLKAVEDVQASSDDKLDQLTARLDHMNGLLTALQTAMNQKDAQLDALQGQIAELQEKQNAARMHLDDCNDKLATVRQQVMDDHAVLEETQAVAKDAAVHGDLLEQRMNKGPKLADGIMGHVTSRFLQRHGIGEVSLAALQGLLPEAAVEVLCALRDWSQAKVYSEENVPENERPGETFTAMQIDTARYMDLPDEITLDWEAPSAYGSSQFLLSIMCLQEDELMPEYELDNNGRRVVARQTREYFDPAGLTRGRYAVILVENGLQD